MKKLSILLVIILIPVLISGCNNSDPNDNTYQSGSGYLKVSIKWDEFNNNQTQSLANNNISTQDNNLQITHTGARVVYEGENTSFTQRVERETAEDEGIITFDIPSTDNANLYTVAVHHSQEYNGNRALFLGTVENLQIPNDGVVEIKMGDIDWVEATWYPYDDYKNFEDGLTANKDNKEFNIPIYVREPFQVGKMPEYDNLYIKLSGSGYHYENPNGWRTYKADNANSEIGTVHSETYNFQPYVNSTKFNLPTENGRYSIKPIVNDYTISWE